MKAKCVYENIGFERGIDPKRSMEVGLVGRARGVKDFWTYRNGLDVLLDEDEAIEAISPHISERQALNTVVEFDDNSMLRLEYPMEDQTPLLYRGKYYEYKIGPGRRRGYGKVDLKESINENISFKRGQTVRSALDLGLVKELRERFLKLAANPAIGRTSDWGAKKGVRSVDISLGTFGRDQWSIRVNYDIRHGWNRVDNAVKRNIGEEFFEWPSSPGSEEIGYRFYGIKPQYIESFKEALWGGEEMTESIDFERGKDPKEAMGIGKKYLDQQKMRELPFLDYPWINALIENPDEPWENRIKFEELFEYKGIYHIIFKQGGKYASISNKFMNPKWINKYGDPNLSIMSIDHKANKETVIRNIIKRTDKWLEERSIKKAEPYIFESIKFQRGKSPKESMDIGHSANAIRIKELMKWSSRFDDVVPMADTQAIEWLEWPWRNRRATSTSVMLEVAPKESHRLDDILRTKLPLIYRNKIFIPNEYGHYIPHDLNESVSFERGKDPKSSMGIGRFAKEYQAIIDEWDDGSPPGYQYEVVEKFEYKGVPVVLFKEMEDSGGKNPRFHYVAVTYLPDGEIEDAGFHGTPRYAIKRMERLIDWKLGDLNESVSFERGKDPRATMRIGEISKNNFESEEEFVKWLYHFGPILLELPGHKWNSSIFTEPQTHIVNNDTWNKINNLLENRFTQIGKNPGEIVYHQSVQWPSYIRIRAEKEGLVDPEDRYYDPEKLKDISIDDIWKIIENRDFADIVLPENDPTID
jgi:hypothetical protein